MLVQNRGLRFDLRKSPADYQADYQTVVMRPSDLRTFMVDNTVDKLVLGRASN